MPLSPRLIAPTLLAIAAAMALSAQAQPAPRAKAPFPALDLRVSKSEGRRAVELLGDRLPEVAAWYGRTPDQFRQMLINDRRMKLDRRGRLFVEETLDHPLPADPVTADSTGVIDGTLAPLAETFTLHSKPGAKRTVYLNFQGAQLSGTAWNGSGGTINALPYDIDGTPYTFSTTELQRIQGIWQRVAEDYAPFDVNVTTEAPPADQLTRSASGDDVYGTTVLVTSTSGVYSCSCGGVAYVGIFDTVGDFYKPALVFYDKLGSGNEKYVAEAISHEAGHNVGLTHDGYSGGGYYGGHGTGDTGWAPIMGVGYSKPLVQWSKGEYATANNTQDDYNVMAANGLAPRADDHGGSVATATPLSGSVGGGVAELSAQGVVERPGDVDMFSFSAGAGGASFSAAPAARSPNVDLRLELRNAAGQVLASANPANALAASISTTLPSAGTYVLAVTGVGKGDPLTTGYTAYGSVGLYAVAASVPPADGQPPQAALGAAPTRGTVPLTVSFSAAGSTDPDGRIVSYAWTFGDGTTASGPDASHTYTTAGSYSAQLRITDDSGLSATRSVTISADPVVAVLPMRVADIAMSLAVDKRGRTNALAAVTVRDGNGQPVPGATVSGSWSGTTSGSASLTTGSNGVASFKSARLRKSGTVTFTVTDVTLDGYSYRADLNAETRDSIGY
jgi:PKD repeat protein